MHFPGLAITSVIASTLSSNLVNAFVPPYSFKPKSFASELEFGFINNILDKKFELEVIEGVHLPKEVPFGDRAKNLLDLNIQTNIDIINQGGGLPEDAKHRFLGKNRKETLDQWANIHQKAINDVIKNNVDDPDPVPGYLYFGNKKYSEILPLLVKENPFFAMGLTAGKDCLELVSYDGDLMKASTDAKYYKYTSKLTQPDLAINVRFDTDMKISAMTRLENGEDVVISEDEYDKYASGVIYSLVYFASAIHATIHVLHYIMCIGIQHACSNDTSLATWADPYDDNIAVKYLEVSALLMVHKVGDGYPSALKDKHPDAYTVTGKHGFGAATNSIKEYNRDALLTWGKCKTAEDFMDNFLLKDLYASSNGKELIEKAGILTEFKKHAAIVRPFADDLSAAMKASDEKAFTKAEEDLAEFMGACGDGVNEIDNISSWVQLMSMTGIVHGSTLSFTRAIIMPEVLAWRDSSLDEWTDLDLSFVAMFLTADGMEIDRHVMSSSMPNMKIKKWDTSKIAPEVLEVMEKYDTKTGDLKNAYKESLISQGELFREYGWILSDWCPDGFDGKQLTIATYI